MLGGSLRSVPEVTASWTSLRSGARTGPQAPRLTRRQGRNPALVEVPGRDAKSGRDSAHLTSTTLGVPATPLRHAIPCPRCQPLAMNQPRRGGPATAQDIEPLTARHPQHRGADLGPGLLAGGRTGHFLERELREFSPERGGGLPQSPPERIFRAGWVLPRSGSGTGCPGIRARTPPHRTLRRRATS